MEIIATQGLPGSGKSTWASEFMRGKADWVRVNKDEIRNQLFGGSYNRFTEMRVEEARDAAILAALEGGLNVLIDDTNLNPKHLERIEELAFEFSAEHDVEVEVTVQDFTDVPLEERIRRDSGRDRPVGADVIINMHECYME